MALNLEKQLQAVNKDIKALAKKLDKLMVAAGKFEKANAVKTKIVKRAPVKKKVAAPRLTVKKTDKLSATDAALGFIKRSKKGLDTSALVQKTGYDRRKIANIVYRLKSQGKIKSDGKGLYVAA